MNANPVYKKNIELLKQRYFDVAFLDTVNDTSKITIEDCRTGEKTIRIEKDGKAKYVHSKYDPVKEAERLVASLEIERDSTIFVFGMGFLYHIDILFKKTNETNAIYLVEPDVNVLKSCLELFDLMAYLESKRVILLTGNETRDQIIEKVVLGIDSKKRAGLVKSFIMPVYKELYPLEIINFLKIVKHAEMVVHVRENTINEFADRWLLNMIKNINAMLNAYSSEVLAEQFYGKPAIIIAGGPSLDKNIHLLRGLEQKALLLATDTAAMALREKGIKPHIIFTVDPQYAAYRKLYENVPKDAYDDIPIMCFSISRCEILAKHKGKKILTVCNEEFTELLLERVGKKLAFIKYYSSVACLAFAAADFFGCKTIAYVGQDLAYEGDMSHASGTQRRRKVDFSKPGFYISKDIYNKDIITDGKFDTCRVWIEDEIVLRSDRGIEFIDATEGGVYIKGTKVMPLQELIDQYCNETYDFCGKLNEVLNEENLLNLEQKRYMIKTYMGIKNDLRTIEELTKIGKEQVNKIKKMYDHNQAPKERDAQRALEKLQKTFDAIDVCDDAMRFIYLSYRKRELETDKTEREFENATQKEKSLDVAENGQNIFQALEGAIRVVLPVLEQELEKVDKIYLS